MYKNQNNETGIGLRRNENDQRPNGKNEEKVSGQGSVRRSSVSGSEIGLEEKKQNFSPSSDNVSISSDISGTGSAHTDIEENNKPQNATANVADGM